MGVEIDFRAKIAAISAFSGWTDGRRIAWGALAEGIERPCVIIWDITSLPVYHMKGESGFEPKTVQIDSQAMSDQDARATANAIRTALSGFRGIQGSTQFQGVFVRNQRTSDEPSRGAPAVRYHVVSLDFEIWHAPAPAP